MWKLLCAVTAMSDAVITSSVLRGSVTAPPSKSAAHRAILCALLARGKSAVRNVSLSDDIRATIGAAEALGARAVFSNGVLTLDSGAGFLPKAEIDCGESGSTLRFLIPVLAALGIEATLTGHGRLPERPIGVYLDCLPKNGVTLKTERGLPLTIGGKLRPGTFLLPGDVSSQFITGLLLALPLLAGDSRILLSTPLESAGYVDMTLSAMADFGVTARPLPDGWLVPGGQRYLPREYAVEGDWSQAAFFLAAGALGGDLEIRGLRRDSAQGDREAERLFSAFGAKIGWQGETLTASAGTLSGIDIDASQIPDLVPILAATAALARGRTVISRAQRLRIKESDRLAAMADGLNALGAQVSPTPDGLVIDGVPELRSGLARGCNDHRVVMALAVAALRGAGEIRITDAQSVRKSYPDFFEEYNRLGGMAHVI